MEKMTGVKAEDILGKRGYAALFHGAERPMLIDLAIKPNEEIENKYNNFKREDGALVWNKAAEEMTGIPAEGIIGKGDYEHAVPFYGKRRPMIIDLVLQPDKEIEHYYRYLERQGKNLLGENLCPTVRENGAYVSAAASPIYDSHGNIVGAVESIREGGPALRQAD